MPRALVTGGTGFVGPWLARELLERGWAVSATRHEPLPEEHPGLGAEVRAGVQWIECDLRDADATGRALDRAVPDAVFHLAGVSFVPAASADPGAALEVNVIGAARLLAQVGVRRRAGALDPVVLVVGSGLQYGAHDAADLPLRESAAQWPRDVYAASKASQEALALAAWRGEGIRTIAVRAFNHSGPGQAPHFLLPRLVRDARALAASGEAEMEIGNADSVRDFLHVADVVRAYADLAERGVAGEAYNVASGHGVRVDEAAQRVLALAGVHARLKSVEALRRPADVPRLVGSPAKLTAATGWSPRHTLDTIIDDLLRAAPR